MTRGITVKLPTHKVVTALEAKLATIKKDYANQEIYEAKYEKTKAAWQKELTEFAITNIKKAENFRTNYRAWNNTLNIDFDLTVLAKDLPAEPDKDFESMSSYTYKETVEDISNALSILRMTDELTVNASTMKQIAKYL
jgi:hypothetical protein